MKKLFLIPVLLFLACSTVKDSSKSSDSKIYTIGFYNVENLFDIEDDPQINDDEFVPGSDKHWDEKKYLDKIQKISTVILNSGQGEFPIAFGLCEVENKQVVSDLVNSDLLKEGEYGIIHFDSPDERGIDNAFIYRKDYLTIVNSTPIEIDLEKFNSDHTRDILHVEATIKNTKTSVHFFINHFPSRSGGQETSEPKRMEVARILKNQIDLIVGNEKDPTIVIMGDFNDMPDNSSIREVLNACPLQESCFLNNLSYAEAMEKRGTYNYRGEWNMLDQIIVSKNLTQTTNSMHVEGNKALIYRDGIVMYTNDAGETSPSRTYGGNKYFGGYSDHLATYFRLIVTK